MTLTPEERMKRWESALIKTKMCSNKVKVEQGLEGIPAMEGFWECREKKVSPEIQARIKEALAKGTEKTPELFKPTGEGLFEKPKEEGLFAEKPKEEIIKKEAKK